LVCFKHLEKGGVPKVVTFFGIAFVIVEPKRFVRLIILDMVTLRAVVAMVVTGNMEVVVVLNIIRGQQ